MDDPIGIISGCIEGNCCACWLNGCGMNGAFGMCADGLEAVNPCMEQFASIIWCFGSPLAFPCIFFFSPDPHTNETSGYDISALQAPVYHPCHCCFQMTCLPCGQWHLRRTVLGGDMTKYKLWQGHHDGPQCCARQCPSSPFITIRSGTYGEQDCPNLFLCLEVSVLAGFWSTCCAYDVSRQVLATERGFRPDPTEVRQEKCIGFFGNIMDCCFTLGLCFCCTSCCLTLCAPESEGAQECAGESGRASWACCSIAHTIWKGIIFTKVITIGCLSTQMIHEVNYAGEWDGQLKGKDPPQQQNMDDRGGDEEEEIIVVKGMTNKW